MKRLSILAVLAAVPCLAQAAGGHHAVDDAALLEPGQCELESWFARARGGERLLHAGAGCRVGPVELGLAADHARAPDTSQTGWGLQIKWATEVADGFSVGASLGPAWQARARPRYQGTALVLLATWAPSERVTLHGNLGRDLAHRAPDAMSGGIALEWAPAPAWSLVAERYREDGTHFIRGGVRWLAGNAWSLDLSRAHRLSGPAPSAWTLGASWVFNPF